MPTVTATRRATVSVAEAAALLSCHPETIRRMVASGRLQAVRLGAPPGGSLRIPTSALRKLPGVLEERAAATRHSTRGM
jgi:excisionase family DNA binding protein